MLVRLLCCCVLAGPAVMLQRVRAKLAAVAVRALVGNTCRARGMWLVLAWRTVLLQRARVLFRPGHVRLRVRRLRLWERRSVRETYLLCSTALLSLCLMLGSHGLDDVCLVSCLPFVWCFVV